MKTLFSVFKRGFQKTSTILSRSVEGLFKDVHSWTPEDYSKLESVLLQADFGTQITKKMIFDIKDRYQRGLIKTSDDIFQICSEDVKSMFLSDLRALRTAPAGVPTVLMMVGVNGSGKTTTCGKLAGQFVSEGKKVMLCACDTFRAAAVEQL
nr:signal recognition particle receptor subunit alpha [Victivallales bacterium]